MPTTSTPDPKRTNVVAVRLSDAEHAAWIEAANGSGRQQLGRWARERIADVIDAKPTRTHDADALHEFARLRRELTAIGSNLNQLTRQVNAAAAAGHFGKVMPSDTRVWKSLITTRRLLGQIRDKLNEVSS